MHIALNLLRSLREGDIVHVVSGHYVGKTGTIDEICKRKYDGGEWVCILFPGNKVPRLVLKQDVKLIQHN